MSLPKKDLSAFLFFKMRRITYSFTIRFRAHPPGTHWYHGQFPDGHQSNGFLGALVVLPKEGIKEDRDFVAILQANSRSNLVEYFRHLSGLAFGEKRGSGGKLARWN
jgi:FtsP/CotA-like multicopper oxidase with cupredoxin domain